MLVWCPKALALALAYGNITYVLMDLPGLFLLVLWKVIDI